jgi:cell division septal protein FtsQ
VSERPRAARRRSKPSVASRLRAFWILILAGILACAGAAYAFITAPQLHTGAVDVHVEGTHVHPADVLAAAKIDPDANTWLLNTSAIEMRVAAIPYVAQAHLIRTLPAAVELDVTERVPLACLAAGSATWTIDASARVLQRGCVQPGLVRMTIPGIATPAPGMHLADPDAHQLLADIATLTAAHVTVTEVKRDKFGGLVAVDPAGIELLLGSDDDLARKASLVGPVRAALAKGRAVKAVDLRAPDTPTVEFRN